VAIVNGGCDCRLRDDVVNAAATAPAAAAAGRPITYLLYAANQMLSVVGRHQRVTTDCAGGVPRGTRCIPKEQVDALGNNTPADTPTIRGKAHTEEER